MWLRLWNNSLAMRGLEHVSREGFRVLLAGRLTARSPTRCGPPSAPGDLRPSWVSTNRDWNGCVEAVWKTKWSAQYRSHQIPRGFNRRPCRCSRRPARRRAPAVLKLTFDDVEPCQHPGQRLCVTQDAKRDTMDTN